MVIFVPLSVPRLAAMSNALNEQILRLVRLRRKTAGVTVMESESYRLRAEQAEELLELVTEWWKQLERA